MFAFSGEHIFAQSMIHLGIQNIGVGRHSDQAHSPRPTYILHRNDAHKSRGVKQSTYRQYVQCTYYYLPTTTCQQYVLHIYLDFDFVRLGSGRITSSYVTRTRRAQARNPKLVFNNQNSGCCFVYHLHCIKTDYQKILIFKFW